MAQTEQRPDPGDITQALRASAGGGDKAWSELLALVYEDLRRLARQQQYRSPDAITLNATGLVNEAFLRLVNYSNADWADRNHFFAVASKAMRQIVVDECRRRLAEKRGGGEQHVDIDFEQVSASGKIETVLAIDEALNLLQQDRPELAQVVECRFFTGLSEQETAETMGVSLRSVQRYWNQAREQLKAKLG